jgi:hypothetical protein
MIFLKLTVFVALAYNVCAQNFGLYPRESETREVKKLDGVWNFRIIPMGDDQNIGFTQKWFSQPLQLVRYLILVLKKSLHFSIKNVHSIYEVIPQILFIKGLSVNQTLFWTLFEQKINKIYVIEFYRICV